MSNEKKEKKKEFGFKKLKRKIISFFFFKTAQYAFIMPFLRA